MSDPESGDLVATEARSPVDNFMARLQRLLSAGEGYTEVRRAEVDYPVLTFAYRGRYAVLHLFESLDDCHLLRGDGGLPATKTIEVPMLGGDCAFSGGAVFSLTTATATIAAFLGGASAEALGERIRL